MQGFKDDLKITAERAAGARWILKALKKLSSWFRINSRHKSQEVW